MIFIKNTKFRGVAFFLSVTVYPTSAPEATSNPLISNTKSSSPTNSEVDDQDSSIANPVNKEDLAAVLDTATVTPILTKRRSTSDHKDRRDSYFIRQLDAHENDTTIKYHTKAPEQPESLKKIKYRDVLQHLEALLDYEHKYRIKLLLERTISQSCMDQIQSRFNISPKQFHSSSLAQLLTYLSTICTPPTRQEMITFLTMYSCSLCNVTKVPTASNKTIVDDWYASSSSYPLTHELSKSCLWKSSRRIRRVYGSSFKTAYHSHG